MRWNGTAGMALRPFLSQTIASSARDCSKCTCESSANLISPTFVSWPALCKVAIDGTAAEDQQRHPDNSAT
jgi:hypothetical protein